MSKLLIRTSKDVRMREALVKTLIAVAAIAAFQLVGTNLSTIFNTVATKL